MRRAHRRTHLVLWLILGPIIAAILYLAIEQRPPAPVNEALPANLTVEAG